MIYLNAEFEGGETVFYEKNSRRKSHCVKPQTGMCIVFYQGNKLPHEGAKIIHGKKYIMRTDVMYECIEDKSKYH